MNKCIIKFLSFYMLAFPIFANETIDLLTLYHDSVESDSLFISQHSSFMASKQASPMAIADLLPSIQASGNWSRIYNHGNSQIQDTSSTSASQSINNKYGSGYNLSLSQPLFDLAKWQNLAKANSQVKRDVAIFNNNFQEFIIRVSESYLNILRAKDNLILAKSEQKAFKRQLTQTQHRFQVGLETRTAVDSAKAAYDSAIAKTIAEQNILENTISFLSVLSGKTYKDVKTFGDQIPLVKPEPLNYKQWIIKALTQNYLLSAEYYNKEMAKKDISIARSKHLPIISANADYKDTRYAQNSANPFKNSTFKNKISSINLGFSLPLFNGGKIVAETKQAAYTYSAAVAKYDSTRRILENQTLQLFNRIVSKLHQIKALKQAVKSAESAKKSTSESYKQGASTIVDLLNAQKDVFSAKQSLSSSIYDYLLDSLKLKKLAGTLSEEDLIALNKYLT